MVEHSGVCHNGDLAEGLCEGTTGGESGLGSEDEGPVQGTSLTLPPGSISLHRASWEDVEQERKE